MTVLSLKENNPEKYEGCKTFVREIHLISIDRISSR